MVWFNALLCVASMPPDGGTALNHMWQKSCTLLLDAGVGSMHAIETHGTSAGVHPEPARRLLHVLEPTLPCHIRLPAPLDLGYLWCQAGC